MQLPDIIANLSTREKGIGFKKCFCEDGNEVVVMLALPDDEKEPAPNQYGIAKQVTALAIYDMWGYRTDLRKTYSYHDKTFSYEVGKTYAPANGIWYWPTFKEARAYWLNANGIIDERYIRLVNNSI